jgi:hypothetical protein
VPQAQANLEQNKKNGGDENDGQHPHQKTRELHFSAFADRVFISLIATSYAPIATARPVPSFEIAIPVRFIGS